MKVYVLSNVWQFDSGDAGNEVKVFKTFTMAQAEMEKEMETARTDFNSIETDEDKYVKGSKSWSIWEKGEYCYNHIDLKITEHNI